MSARIVIRREPMYHKDGQTNMDGKKTKDKLPYMCTGKCSVMDHYVGATACTQCPWYDSTENNYVLCDNPVIVASHKKMGLRV